MKKKYKIQLPKGKKVTMANIDFEDGVMTVNVELENDFHKAMHDEMCGVFGKINNQWKEVLKANGITREKIEEMGKESIKELEKNCPDIWDRMIQEYGEAICGNTEQKYEPKDGDFVYVKAGYEHIAIFKKEVGENMYVYANWNMSFSVSKIIIDDSRPLCCIHDLREIRPATERGKKLLINKLAEKGKRWNEKEKRIEDIEYIPQNGDIVTMPMVSDLANFLKAKKYIAIYKREDIEAEKIYCYFIIGQHRNGDTFVFEEDHITDNGTMISEIKLATEEEKYLLFDKLAESGKRWNEETKQIEDVRWRAGMNKPYYYIIGFDNIVGTTDARLACDEIDTKPITTSRPVKPQRKQPNRYGRFSKTQKRSKIYQKYFEVVKNIWYICPVKMNGYGDSNIHSKIN